MSSRKKIVIGLILVVVIGALTVANFAFHRTDAVSVTVEKIERHDLEAIVSASGKVQAKRSVDISAETMGKIVNLTVAEGQLVKKGELLLQIDPRNLETAVQNREASLATARSTLQQTRAQVESSRVALKQAEDTFARQEGLFKNGLLSRQEFEQAQHNVELRRTDLQVAEQAVKTQEQRIRQEEASLESARYDLNKVSIVAPMDGIITRRNVEEGETAVVGTMNNAGTVLLTIADLSVIETEIEVDETDIPDIRIGQPATITIDAFPDKTFNGTVTEVGNSPIQATGTNQTGRATNFQVVVTIDGEVPNVRPGFTCTAEITTGTREHALGVPIQAMTVRELVVDASGAIVKPEVVPGSTRQPIAPQELQPGQERKEFEGVFVVRDGKAAFVPVKTGIVGDKYFEVLDGLAEGDQVITGPFASVRNLREGDAVTIDTSQPATTTTRSTTAN